MLKIDLGNYKTHRVEIYNDTYIVGRILDSEGNIIRSRDIYLLLSKYKTINEIIEIIKGFYGHFAIVYKNESEIFVFQDIIRSIPIFYINDMNSNSLIITDNPYKYTELLINEIEYEEFLAACYISGNETLFSNINQIEAGCWLYAQNINGEFHFNYGRYSGLLHEFSNTDELQVKVSELDNLYNTVIKRLINYLDGRRVVIPLSGGHDSRLILYYLKKNGYKNITTFSYGWDNIHISEGSIAEKVAKYLGAEYKYIPYRKYDIKNIIKDKKRYMDVLLYCGIATSFPHLQDWYAIDYLTTNKLIPKDSVIVPGHAGDFIAGSHIKLKHIIEDQYTLEGVMMDIINKHYYHYPWQKIKPENKEVFLKRVFDSVPLELQKNNLSKFETVRLMEFYNYKERQTKLIANSVRIYEFYNYDWFLPLWDKDLVEFWADIPIEELFERRLFKKFVNQTYPELMKAAPIYEKENSDKIANHIKSNNKKEMVKKFFFKGVLFYKAFINSKTYDSINLLSYVSNFKIAKSIVFYNSINIDFLWLNDFLRALRRKKKQNEIYTKPNLIEKNK